MLWQPLYYHNYIMSASYSQYEKQVYDWLMSEHEKDNSFCFSTRQKAAKGAEKDYFIGTSKSGYFATTFWWIPISFPGSSNDLIDIIFRYKKGAYFSFIQFNQMKTTDSRQNELALEFIRELKPALTEAGINIHWETAPERKMEYFEIILSEAQKNIDNFFQQMHAALEKILPVIDSLLADFKNRHVDFIGERITQERFDNTYQRRLKERLAKAEPAVSVSYPADPVKPDASLVPDFDLALNTIFYGPPGTGKTYTTTQRAVQIADPLYYLENNEDRTLLHQRYADLLFQDFDSDNDNQIAFCTFHQSLSYEDFIEGIKPKAEGGIIKYEVQDGIFKKIAKAAKDNYQAALEINSEKEPFELVLSKLKEKWESNKEMPFKMKTAGYDFTILEFNNTSIRYKTKGGWSGNTLSLATLADAYYGKKEIQRAGVGNYYPGILKEMNSLSAKVSVPNELKNYVLIIDEINRGNVSQIFGELITAIEKTKRLGNKMEELEIMLPYSQEPFIVPPNLYIIGTMNTADRSVEALDTALRRRFSFEEMLPKSEIISGEFKKVFFEECEAAGELDWEDPEWKKTEIKYLDFVPARQYGLFRQKLDELDLDTISDVPYDDLWETAGIELLTVKLLNTINERIEMLLDRDHLIGHSFFIGVYKWEALKKTIYANVIPLLQEYFYGDYGKIGMILGTGFVRIKHDTSRNKVTFSDFKYADASQLQKTVYELIPANQVEIKSAYKSLINEKSNEGE